MRTFRVNSDSAIIGTSSNGNLLKWCIKENEFFSGRTLKFQYDGKLHFLMAFPDDETLIIDETDLSLNQLKEISGALCDLFETKTIKANLPEFLCDEGEKIIFSIYKRCGPGDG